MAEYRIVVVGAGGVGIPNLSLSLTINLNFSNKQGKVLLLFALCKEILWRNMIQRLKILIVYLKLFHKIINKENTIYFKVNL